MVSRMSRTNPMRCSQRGSSLIEVLISLVVLSVGVMGMAVLHGRAVQYAVGAEDRNRAAVMADELVSKMWDAKTTSIPAATLTAWQSRLTNAAVSGLPNASGSVSAADSDGAVTITISWYPPGVSSSNAYQYITKAAVP